MTIRPETQQHLDAVERHAKRSFRYRGEIAVLMDLSELNSLQPLFADLIFQSKFSTNAVNILKRSGPGTDETAKLSAELKQSLEKISNIFHNLLAEAPGDVKDKFMSTFLSETTAGFDNLMNLLTELGWVKNYELDRGRGRL